MAIIKKKTLSLIICLSIILSGFTPCIKSVKNDQKNIIAPKQVIITFFKYYNQKNVKSMNTLTTENYKFSEVNPGFKNLKYIKILKITESTSKDQKEIYIRSRKKNQFINSDIEIEDLNNITIFKVSFEVKYKNDKIGAISSGRYGYNYTLLRKDKNSPWLIDSSGY